MTTLICTKCQSAVAVTGRSVTLPFICDSCSCIQGSSDGPGYFKCSIPSCYCQNDPNYRESSPLIATEAPSCGDASVEATTKIIDDLTAQLEAERQTVMTGEGRIVELGTQITDLCDQNIELLATIDKLKSEVEISHRQCFEILARVYATTLS